jgi:hypothetical protein
MVRDREHSIVGIKEFLSNFFYPVYIDHTQVDFYILSTVNIPFIQKYGGNLWSL